MTDRELIDSLGGPSRVAAILGTSPQRVSNWIKRGIPAQMKVDHPELFMPRARKKAKA